MTLTPPGRVNATGRGQSVPGRDTTARLRKFCWAVIRQPPGSESHRKQLTRNTARGWSGPIAIPQYAPHRRDRPSGPVLMEIPVFDLSLPKLLVLAVLALIVFGPNELPKMAAKACRALRDLRQIADGAKADLRKGLGPEFSGLDLDDLNPRRFVQKHLLSDLNRDDPDRTEGSGKAPATALAADEEPPPYDAEAT